jgi:coenzyme F420 hydrogenase subunit beta
VGGSAVVELIDAQAKLSQVVDGGYCVGCGACAAFDKRIRMSFDRYQRLQAVLPKGTVQSAAAAVCPFSDGNPDENTLGQQLFSSDAHVSDERIGRHLATFGGWVEEGNFREQGSSGGIGTWLLAELLGSGMVDAVVSVIEAKDGPNRPMFGFAVFSNRDDVLASAKTRYYPVEISAVLSHIRSSPGRYAIIGVPCFIKALRLSALSDSVLAERMRFLVAIVCGHMKSAAFAEAIAWQCGVPPPELNRIDFRVKIEGRPASRYGVTVTARRDDKSFSITRPMQGMVGANWGHGLFKMKACEFCDDVLGETADLTVGDAWLPAYDGDHRGANIVVVRTSELLSILQKGAEEGRLHLDSLSADEIAASQAGGLRHRRDGLAYRLWLTDRSKRWRPKKRVRASRNHLDPQMQRIHLLRYELGQRSHALFSSAREGGGWLAFEQAIRPLIETYDRQMAPSVFRRVANRIRRGFRVIQQNLIGRAS